jgi:hypothetical protein
LDPASIAFAAAILDELDPGLRAQVHDPLAAQGIVYALLLEGDDQALRAAQVQNLRDRLPEPILSATMDAVPRVDHLLPERRLALADITAMSLHGLSLSQRQDLLENVQRLILADQKATPFEVALQRNLVRFLSSRKASPGSPAGGTKPAPVPSAPAGADVAGETRRLLSALAFAGNDERADAARAFSVGANRLGWLSGTDQMLEESVPTPESVRDALRRLALASPATQRSVLEACAATIAADDHITPRENELFRVVSSALGAPPPLSTL